MKKTVTKNSSISPFQEVAWHGGQFVIPEDWELAAFSTNPEQGALAFHSPSGEEGKYRWRRVKDTPDIPRTQLEAHRRVLAEEDFHASEKLSRLDALHIGRFRLAWKREGEFAQAACYLPEEKYLLEWMFPTYHKEKVETIWKPLFLSFTPHAPNNDKQKISVSKSQDPKQQENTLIYRRWALLGICVTLPVACEIEEVHAAPASVALTFSTLEKLILSTRRWGLARHHLASKAFVDWYRKDVISKLHGRALVVNETEVAGYKGVVVEYEMMPEFFMERIIGRWWKGKGLAWHVPEENRIYSFEQVGPKKAMRVDMKTAFPALPLE